MTDSEQHHDSPVHHGAVTNSPAVAALQNEMRFLRALLVTSLMSLILLSFSVNLYVFRQVSIIRKELDVSNAVLREYQAKREPLINSFISSLQAFARNHTDLTPILERYGIAPAATPPALTPLAPHQGGK